MLWTKFAWKFLNHVILVFSYYHSFEMGIVLNSFKHFNPLHQRILCAKFVEIGPVDFWEDQNMKSVQQQQQQQPNWQTTDNFRSEKLTWAFWFIWINNTLCDHHLKFSFFLVIVMTIQDKTKSSRNTEFSVA